ncbi:hypothetical protein E1H18_337 [Caulobacter sp. RHG1]|nr:hypothetical protein [Caulobacter sp. RHG1]
MSCRALGITTEVFFEALAGKLICLKRRQIRQKRTPERQASRGACR